MVIVPIVHEEVFISVNSWENTFQLSICQHYFVKAIYKAIYTLIQSIYKQKVVEENYLMRWLLDMELLFFYPEEKQQFNGLGKQ
jgi:hypothetical protein